MKKFFLSMMAVMLLNSCYNDNAEILYGTHDTGCNAIQAKYATDISQIVTTKCAIAGCHNANAANNPAGFSLLTYQQVSAKKDRINARVVIEKTMPPSGPLPAADINKLACWIASGAPNN
ncbi:MAG: hypothetical protein ABIN94_20590 [Ferruginibacter sp.]